MKGCLLSSDPQSSDLAVTLLRTCPSDMERQIPNSHTDALSNTIHNSQKVGIPKCPSHNEYSIYIVHFGLIAKRNEVPMFAMVWMDISPKDHSL